MKHLICKRNKNNFHKSHLNIVLWVLLFVTFVVQIFLTVHSLGKGSLIAVLEKDAETIRLENRKFQRELVAKTSLSNLSKKAEELGFKNLELPYYVKVEDLKAQALR